MASNLTKIVNGDLAEVIRCQRCGGNVYEAEKLLTSVGCYHPGCFKCAKCSIIKVIAFKIIKLAMYSTVESYLNKLPQTAQNNSKDIKRAEDLISSVTFKESQLDSIDLNMAKG